MDICILHTASDSFISKRINFIHGRLSYIADGTRLLSELRDTGIRGGIMVVAADRAAVGLEETIYSEYIKRKYSAVFLDISDASAYDTRPLETLCAALSRRFVKIFCPMSAKSVCKDAIPVADACVSGGNFEEYILSLTKAHRSLALHIPCAATEFTMPAKSRVMRALSKSELLKLLSRNENDCFFSPQLMTNYIIYSEQRDIVRYALFDDAYSVSRKLRFAKSAGVDTAFLLLDEAREIFDKITL